MGVWPTKLSLQQKGGWNVAQLHKGHLASLKILVSAQMDDRSQQDLFGRDVSFWNG